MHNGICKVDNHSSSLEHALPTVVQLLPSAGQGAICAMQDAVVLVNCLHDMASWNGQEIKAALNDYKEQRYPPPLFLAVILSPTLWEPD